MTEEQTIAEVKEAISRSFAAFRSRNLDEWKRFARPDAYGYYYGSGLLDESPAGDQLYDFIRDWFEAGMTSTMSPSHIAVRLAASDVAIATYYIRGSETYPDGRSIEGTWRATSVLTRDAGKWKTLHYHVSPLTTSQTERRAQTESPVSVSGNKAKVQRAIEEIWHKGNLAVIDELYAADYVFHGPASTRAVLHGPEGYRQVVRIYRTAFPDIHFTIEQLVEEGDKVVCRWTTRGTHRGELSGVAPTGRKATTPGVSVFLFAAGKIAEERSYWDERYLWQELGVAPPAR